MSNFDFPRFKTLLKYEIITQRKSYLRLIIASFLAMLAFMVYNAVSYIQYTNYQLAVWPEEKASPYYTEDILVFGGFFIFLITLISASHIFSNMDTKQNRIRLLMLPATNREKYLCRWSIYTLMAFIALVATYIAADIVAAVIRVGMGLSFELSIINLFGDLSFPTTFKSILQLLYDVSILFAVVSTYVLGGTLFRKVPFILTSIVIGATWFALMIVILILVMIIASDGSTFHSIFNNIKEEHVYILLFPLFTLWSAFAHWLSYRTFCRSSVIGHKRIGM